MVKKGRKCSACGRPCKGHTGPTGDKCPEMQQPPAAPNKKPPAPSHPPGPSGPKDPDSDGSDPKVRPEPGPIALDGEDGVGSGDPKITPEPLVPDSQVPPAPGMGVGSGRPGLLPHGQGGEPLGGLHTAPYSQHNNLWYGGSYGLRPPMMYGQSTWSPQMFPAGSVGPRQPAYPGVAGSDGPRPMVSQAASGVDWRDVGASLSACGAMMSGGNPGTIDQASMVTNLKLCIENLTKAVNNMPDRQYENSHDLNTSMGAYAQAQHSTIPHQVSAMHVQHPFSQSVHQMSSAYSVDTMYPNYSVRSHGRNPFQPGTMQHKLCAQGVPSKTINSAIEGECVPLEHFLPPIGASSNISNPDLECVLDNETNSMTYRPKNHSRKIVNHDTWSQAWVSYEKLMVAVFGNSIHESMADYRATILDYSKKYVWSSVCVYDFRHRSRMATQIAISDRLNFNAVFNDLTNTILDTTAIKPNATRCARCKAYDHMVRDCPFPEGWKGGQNQGQVQAKKEIQEICFNYNKERCTNDKCKRRHICRYCKGNLPFTQCKISGNCSRGSVPS